VQNWWTNAWKECKRKGYHRKRNRFLGKIEGLSTCKGAFPTKRAAELEIQSNCKRWVLENTMEIGKLAVARESYLGKRV